MARTREEFLRTLTEAAREANAKLAESATVREWLDPHDARGSIRLPVRAFRPGVEELEARA